LPCWCSTIYSLGVESAMPLLDSCRAGFTPGLAAPHLNIRGTNTNTLLLILFEVAWSEGYARKGVERQWSNVEVVASKSFLHG
jgi:hypothetical protein